MTVSFSTRVSVPEGVMIREIDGESVILNLSRESYFGLDRVGTRCWNWLVESSTIEDACHRLSETYEIETDRAVTDMKNLITQLVEGGLMEVHNDSESKEVERQM